MSTPADIVHTREAMIARGGYGYLSKAVERFIPLNRIVVLTPVPACPEWATYATVGGPCAIEVKYSRDDDVYLAFNAAGVINESRKRGDAYIHAFVEPDRDEVGAGARLTPLGEGEAR
jgi:hypothetical protein